MSFLVTVVVWVHVEEPEIEESAAETAEAAAARTIGRENFMVRNLRYSRVVGLENFEENQTGLYISLTVSLASQTVELKFPSEHKMVDFASRICVGDEKESFRARLTKRLGGEHAVDVRRCIR